MRKLQLMHLGKEEFQAPPPVTSSPLGPGIQPVEDEEEMDEDDVLIDNIEKLALEAGATALILDFPCSDPTRSEETAFNVDQSLVTATRDQLTDATSRCPLETKTIEGETLSRERALMLLQLRAYQLQSDPNHVALEGMKPRYRAFSVYTVDDERIGMRAVENHHYADPPAEDAKSLYGWETVRISSPVLPVSPAASIMTTAGDICRVMRNNFRIHRDMASIPTSMQISVSHTKGFTLLEVKKIISLYTLIEPHLRQLNRGYRASSAYQNICGSVRRWSNLGQVSVTELGKNFDPDRILPSFRSEAMLGEMDQYMPTDILAYGDDVSQSDQIFFVSLWCYADITSLCKAVTNTGPFRKTSLVALCRGGEYTEETDLTEDEEFEAAKAGLSNANFNIVDASRGVFKFRGAAHTLDPAHISCWSIICASVVNFAKHADPETFKAAVTGIVLGGTPMLEVIGVPYDVQKWYKSRMQDSGSFMPDDVVDQISWNDPFYARV
ncbi:hypothetical protein F4820DRAFT_422272 [Hypoxylon rubiginosum]|uniref:Uncharacterized protein n=1 Tax=Hypoxylon rubiginosum TaxID=110542 RepID=A0ACB9YZL2_9PEZI|nr:hypothetical protein F4820DRAFT_422272 [Hypoxylon rubiginosum]